MKSCLNETARARVTHHIPFAATIRGKRGRVIGRLLDWPLFRPDDGSADIEVSWHLADRKREEG